MRGRIEIWGLGWVGFLVACGGITQPLGDLEGGSGNSTGSSSTGGSSHSATGGGNTAGSHPCETECVQKVFAGQATSCKLCHSNLPLPNGVQSSSLDLQSPGFTARLKDVPAKHTDLAMGMSYADCPTGDKLIDTANPENSWLLKKLQGKQGACGTAMPQPPTTLKADEMACMTTYVYCVAGQ